MSSSLLAFYYLHMYFLTSCSCYIPHPFHSPSLDQPITLNKGIWSLSLWKFHKFLLLPLHKVQILSLAFYSQTPSTNSSPMMYLLQWFSNVWVTSFWAERNQCDLFCSTLHSTYSKTRERGSFIAPKACICQTTWWQMWCINSQKKWHTEATSYMWRVTILNAHILRTSLQTVNYLIYLHCCASAIDLGVDLSQPHHLKSYIKTDSLHPTKLTIWIGVILKKLTVPWLDKKFTKFYEIRRLTAIISRTCHLYLSCTRQIQFKATQPIY